MYLEKEFLLEPLKIVRLFYLGGYDGILCLSSVSRRVSVVGTSFTVLPWKNIWNKRTEFEPWRAFQRLDVCRTYIHTAVCFCLRCENDLKCKERFSRTGQMCSSALLIKSHAGRCITVWQRRDTRNVVCNGLLVRTSWGLHRCKFLP
jgi:hypothetical protein